MLIKPIIELCEKEISFLKKHGSVFIQPDWLKIYDKSKIELNGIYNKGNDLIGAFTLYLDTKFGQTWIKTPPYSPHISLFYLNPSSNNAKKNTFDKKIYKAISGYISSRKHELLTIALPPNHIDMQPFIWDGYKVIPNYTYRINLTNITEDNILKMAAPEKRNEQKKAIKDGVTSELTFDYKIINQMVEHTFDRKNKNLNTLLISKILNNFSNKENSYSFASKLNNENIAASFIVHNKDIAYYLLGGYHSLKKHNGAGVLSLFNAIKEAKKRNLTIFDFEGSMLPEVEKYFRAFGGELTPYYTLNKASFLLETLLKKGHRSQF